MTELLNNEALTTIFTKEQLDMLKAMGITQPTKKGKVTKLPSIKAKAPSVKDLPITVSYSEFKGNDLIALVRGESSFVNKPFSFGKGKAKMIVEQFEAIKAFAEL